MMALMVSAPKCSTTIWCPVQMESSCPNTPLFFMQSTRSYSYFPGQKQKGCLGLYPLVWLCHWLHVVGHCQRGKFIAYLKRWPIYLGVCGGTARDFWSGENEGEDWCYGILDGVWWIWPCALIQAHSTFSLWLICNLLMWVNLWECLAKLKVHFIHRRLGSVGKPLPTTDDKDSQVVSYLTFNH